MQDLILIFKGTVAVVALGTYLGMYTFFRFYSDDPSHIRLNWRNWSRLLVQDHLVITGVVLALYGLGILVDSLIF